MERVLDRQGRWRNKVVAFRMSPEEDALLDAKVRLSGLTKQEYIIRRLTVTEEISPDLLETIQMVALTLNGLKEECE